MDFFSTSVVPFLEQYGYPAAFATMLISGPIGALVAGFFAGTGFFNPWYIWLLDIVADLTSDVFYYGLGRFGGRKLFARFSRLFHWSGDLMAKAEWLFQKHGKKTIFIVKFTQGIGTLTQASAGLGRMPFRSFFLINLIGSTIKSAILVLTGMLAGTAWEVWAERVENVTTIITAVVVVFIILIIATFQVQKRIFRKLEND